MKYDNNQYYYSPSQNYPWYLSDNKPDDAIPMTIAMEEKYEAGIKQGLIIQPNSTKNGFVMVNPDDLLTSEELVQRIAQQLKNAANSMLAKTDRFEHDVYQSKMKDGESNEFDTWRIELLDVALGDSSVIPITPEFMNKFLELQP